MRKKTKSLLFYYNIYNMILSKNRTLIILDWDDTLFPTTWITTNDINLKNDIEIEKYKPYFAQIDLDLNNLLIKLTQCGTVIIVTNALLPWIKLSTINLPKTSIILNKIKIISARREYQSKSLNPMDWKKLAFESILKTTDKKINNIISVGDAEYEYNALISLFDCNPQTYKLLKSVKFIKYPTKEIIIDQIRVLERASIKIATTKTHLDVKFNQK
jgi:hypothetical protein